MKITIEMAQHLGSAREVSRAQLEIADGAAQVEHQTLAQILELAVGHLRVESDPAPGRCGKTMPHLEGATPTHCALAAGHEGWHRDETGHEAGVGW